MAEDARARSREARFRRLAAIFIAFLAYLAVSLLVNLVTAAPIVALDLDATPWVQIGKSLASAALGLWLGRVAADRLIGDYSGRLVFVAFAALGLAVVAGGALVARTTWAGAVNVAGLVFLLVFAFLWFWRRDGRARPVQSGRNGQGRGDIG